MSAQTFNEIDLDSPGYEYMRSHRSMNSLYLKLVALNYQRDFCLLYKCPQIHKYYFSTPNKNPSEQLFNFTCFCAWLIKHKCNMNLDLAPEDYQDVETTIGVIFEALKLLLLLDSEQDDRAVSRVISFAPLRLMQGFGPEVIWTLSVLADRALELTIEASPGLGKPQIFHHEKQQPTNLEGPRNAQSNSSIHIGQPVVGGGLTTRPLGNYRVDDSALLLGGDEASPEQTEEEFEFLTSDPADWYRQVERDKQALKLAAIKLEDDTSESTNGIDWTRHINKTRNARLAIGDFLNQARSLLETIANRVDKQLQIINSREKFLQKNLSTQLEEFKEVWRQYSIQSKRNKTLTEQVCSKTDLFESGTERLRLIGSQMNARTVELNDGTKLKKLQAIVDSLETESRDLSLKVNLLLVVYAKKQAKARMNDH